MTDWKVTVVGQAKAELSKLPSGLFGKLLALLKLAEQIGLPKIPYKRRKHLGGEIWEFRVNALEGIARALYATREREIIVLAVFAKKTGKTPLSMIRLAEKRLREVLQ
jgi:phage-related protein